MFDIKIPVSVQIGGAVVAVLVAGYAGIYAYDWIGDQREAQVVTRYEKQIADAKEVANEESRRMQASVDHANTRVIELEQARADAESRIGALSLRMRNAKPSADSLARLSKSAVSGYAAEVERDFESCRAEYEAMGSIAAGASIAAWSHRDAWPAISREKLDKMRLTNREKK